MSRLGKKIACWFLPDDEAVKNKPRDFDQGFMLNFYS